MREGEPFEAERIAILERLEAARMAGDQLAEQQCLRELDALAMNQQAIVRQKIRKARSSAAVVPCAANDKDEWDMAAWLAKEYAEMLRPLTPDEIYAKRKEFYGK
jgi:hypothetical protein